MKKVLIIYKFLPQYRIEFLDKLKNSLHDDGIELILIYGRLKNENSKKNDERDLEWAIYRENKIIKLGKINFVWQPSLDMLSKVDLVIVEQANKLLVNYFIIILSKFMTFKFAFWGHGTNFKDDLNGIKNRFLYFFLNKSDYWFAYTNGVKRFLIEKGVSKKKIVVVNNAIDTITLKNEYDKLSKSDVVELKNELNIKSNQIALYCGGIYKEKKIDILIEASKKIKEEIKDFNLIIIGSGPESNIVEDFSKNKDWVHFIGNKFGIEKVPYFKISTLFLLPGAVGLAALDALSMQTPLITTDKVSHGPEIEYIINGNNGIITKGNIEEYSNQVIYLFKNIDIIEKLKKGCIESSTLYNTDNMVNNFKQGVLECLTK